MLKTLLVFCSLIITQNARTQFIQNGCNCQKISNLALSQILGNNFLNQRSVNNVQSVDFPYNIGLSPQNGQLNTNMLLNGLNLNNIGTNGNDLLITNNFAPNQCAKTANNVLRTKNNLPSQLASNALFNELVSHAIAASTSNVPTIRSTINNELLNNGVQYNAGIQIDKEDLWNKIINNKGVINKNMDGLEIVHGDTVPVVTGIQDDANDYNNIDVLKELINKDNQLNRVSMQSDNYLLALQEMPDNSGILYIENIVLPLDALTANNMVFNLKKTTDKIPVIANNVCTIGNQMYVYNDVTSQTSNKVVEPAIPTTYDIHPAKCQLSNNLPNNIARTHDFYETQNNNALPNNMVQTNSNPLVNTLFFSNSIPVSNNQYDNLYNPNLNLPNHNILFNANELIGNNQISLNNNNHEVQMPKLESYIANTGVQYDEDITSLKELSLNNIVNANIGDLRAQTPLHPILQTNQMNNLPITGNIYNEQALSNLPVSLVQLEESLDNIQLSMPTKLLDWNTLNLGQYGCLPIINGLPVAGITETVTVMNPNNYS